MAFFLKVTKGEHRYECPQSLRINYYETLSSEECLEDGVVGHGSIHH